MANDPQTFEELKVSVLSWSNLDDIDGEVEELIALAERRLSARIQGQELTTTLTATSDTVALPADFAGVRSLWIDSPRNCLTAMPLDGMLFSYPGTGTPVAYCEVGTNLVLAPEPAGTTTLNLTYWRSVPALSDSNPTNWLLTARPDLYLAAVLVEVFLYKQSPEEAAPWEQRTAGKIAEVNAEYTRRKYSGPLRPRAQVVI